MQSKIRNLFVIDALELARKVGGAIASNIVMPGGSSGSSWVSRRKRATSHFNERSFSCFRY